MDTLPATQRLDVSFEDEPCYKEEEEKVQVAALEIKGKRYPVYSGKNTIGRDHACNILVEEMALSKEHARLEVLQKNSHILYDLGSTNGTYLGSTKLKANVRYHIKDGDKIKFGNIACLYIADPKKLGLDVESEEDISSQSLLEDSSSTDDGSFIVPETPAQARNEQNKTNVERFSVLKESVLLVPESPGAQQNKSVNSPDVSFIESSQRISNPQPSDKQNGEQSVKSGSVQNNHSTLEQSPKNAYLDESLSGDEDIFCAVTQDYLAGEKKKEASEEDDIFDQPTQLFTSDEKSSAKSGPSSDFKVPTVPTPQKKPQDLLSEEDDIFDMATQPNPNSVEDAQNGQVNHSKQKREADVKASRSGKDMELDDISSDEDEDIFCAPTQKIRQDKIRKTEDREEEDKFGEKDEDIFDMPTQVPEGLGVPLRAKAANEPKSSKEEDSQSDSIYDMATQAFSRGIGSPKVLSQESKKSDKDEDSEDLYNAPTQLPDDIYDIPTQLQFGTEMKNSPEKPKPSSAAVHEKPKEPSSSGKENSAAKKEQESPAKSKMGQNVTRQKTEISPSKPTSISLFKLEDVQQQKTSQPVSSVNVLKSPVTPKKEVQKSPTQQTGPTVKPAGITASPQKPQECKDSSVQNSQQNISQEKTKQNIPTKSLSAQNIPQDKSKEVSKDAKQQNVPSMQESDKTQESDKQRALSPDKNKLPSEKLQQNVPTEKSTAQMISTEKPKLQHTNIAEKSKRVEQNPKEKPVLESLEKPKVPGNVSTEPKEVQNVTTEKSKAEGNITVEKSKAQQNIAAEQKLATTPPKLKNMQDSGVRHQEQSNNLTTDKVQVTSKEPATSPSKAEQLSVSPTKPGSQTTSVISPTQSPAKTSHQSTPPKPASQASSPVRSPSLTPSPAKLTSHAPSTVKPPSLTPSPSKSPSQVPSSVKPPSLTPPSGKPASQSPPAKAANQTPSPVRSTSQTPSPIKTSSQTSSLVKPTTQPPSPIKPTSQTPSPIKPTSQAPSPIKPTSQAPSPIKPTSQAPSPIKPTSQAPSLVKPTSQTPSPIKPTCQTPSPIKPTSQTPSPMKPSSQSPSPMKPSSQPPSPMKPTSQTPSPIKPTGQAPSPIKLTSQTLSPIKPTSQTLSPIKPTSQTLSPIKPTSQTLSPIKPTSQTLSPIKPTSQTLSPIKPTCQTLSPIKPTSQAPSPTKPISQYPSPTKPISQSPSPTKPISQTPSPTKPVSQTPSPAKATDQSPLIEPISQTSPTKLSQTPSSVKSALQAPSPAKPESLSSPAKTVTQIPSVAKPESGFKAVESGKQVASPTRSIVSPGKSESDHKIVTDKVEAIKNIKLNIPTIIVSSAETIQPEELKLATATAEGIQKFTTQEEVSKKSDIDKPESKLQDADKVEDVKGLQQDSKVEEKLDEEEDIFEMQTQVLEHVNERYESRKETAEQKIEKKKVVDEKDIFEVPTQVIGDEDECEASQSILLEEPQDHSDEESQSLLSPEAVAEDNNETVTDDEVEAQAGDEAADVEETQIIVSEEEAAKKKVRAGRKAAGKPKTTQKSPAKPKRAIPVRTDTSRSRPLRSTRSNEASPGISQRLGKGKKPDVSQAKQPVKPAQGRRTREKVQEEAESTKVRGKRKLSATETEKVETPSKRQRTTRVSTSVSPVVTEQKRQPRRGRATRETEDEKRPVREKKMTWKVRESLNDSQSDVSPDPPRSRTRKKDGSVDKESESSRLSDVDSQSQQSIESLATSSYQSSSQTRGRRNISRENIQTAVTATPIHGRKRKLASVEVEPIVVSPKQRTRRNQISESATQEITAETRKGKRRMSEENLLPRKRQKRSEDTPAESIVPTRGKRVSRLSQGKAESDVRPQRRSGQASESPAVPVVAKRTSRGSVSKPEVQEVSSRRSRGKQGKKSDPGSFEVQPSTSGLSTKKQTRNSDMSSQDLSDSQVVSGRKSGRQGKKSSEAAPVVSQSVTGQKSRRSNSQSATGRKSRRSNKVEEDQSEPEATQPTETMTRRKGSRGQKAGLEVAVASQVTKIPQARAGRPSSKRKAPLVKNSQADGSSVDSFDFSTQQGANRAQKRGANAAQKRGANVAQKRGTNGAQKVQVMFTGYSAPGEVDVVNELGGAIVEDPEKCTVLVTDKIRRTYKFLCIMAKGKPIVSPEWIAQSSKESSFVDPWSHLLQDKEMEKKYSFTLKKSLTKAKQKPLLQGYSVFVTPDVKPNPTEMKGIIQSLGGQYLSRPPSTWPEKSFVISCNKNKSSWTKLQQKKKGLPIVDAEVILTGILQQSLDLKTHLLK